MVLAVAPVVVRLNLRQVGRLRLVKETQAETGQPPQQICAEQVAVAAQAPQVLRALTHRQAVEKAATVSNIRHSPQQLLRVPTAATTPEAVEVVTHRRPRTAVASEVVVLLPQTMETVSQEPSILAVAVAERINRTTGAQVATVVRES